MTDPASLYELRIEVVTDDEFDDDLDDLDNVPEWPADPRHRRIRVTVATPPQGARYPDREVLDAHRWAAGFLARVAVRIDAVVRDRAREEHHDCQGHAGQFITAGGFTAEECGVALDEYTVWPHAGIESAPLVEIAVPTERVEWWLAVIASEVDALLAYDEELIASHASPEPARDHRASTSHVSVAGPPSAAPPPHHPTGANTHDR